MESKGLHPNQKDNHILTPDEKKSENSETIRILESYSGVCDVYSPEEARAMAGELRKERKNPDRKVMIGVMTHPLALHPDRGIGIPECDGVREVFPTRENLAGGFIDDPDVLNTVHYADLYGPNKGKDIFENLELVVTYGDEYLHAIQIDVTWPNPNEIKKFKEKNKNIAIILQVGKFALKEVGGDHREVANRLREYGDSIDYALLDMSMGQGKGMETEGLLPLLRTIRKELPGLGLAVAGGLGPDSVDLLEPIAREFPDVSIDAQGNVKYNAPNDELGHALSTHPADLERSKEYIKKSCDMLDNPIDTPHL
ncbi:MAG: hypothetical protein HZA36_03905 [Parcubacteria group bacterium]|nr:hypothetical protein [Parcubacteria group bacterium]